MERVGSKYARELFNSKINESEWTTALKSYESAISKISQQKNKPELIHLDKFWRVELREAILSRDPKHITLEEISKVMKWKLIRGKARPLQKLVDSNPASAVIADSTKALEQLSLGHWQKAIEAISNLKGSIPNCNPPININYFHSGIGVATATAVLSCMAPDLVPFMADEAIEAATNLKRDYTLKTYCAVRSSLVEKARELGDRWTAELVGRALWAKSVLPYPESEPCPASGEIAASNNGGEKKRKSDQEAKPKKQKR